MKATSPNIPSLDAEVPDIKQEPPDDIIPSPPASPVNQAQSNNPDVVGYSQKHYPLAGGTLFSVFSPVMSESNKEKCSTEWRGKRGRPRGPRKAPGFIQEMTGNTALKTLKSRETSQPSSLSAPMRHPASTRDLPYMGQLTLNNKPRRGRKPKKVDICHLISKNYGISIPKQLEISEVKTVEEPLQSKPVDAPPSIPEIPVKSETPSPPDFMPVAVKLEEPDYWDNDYKPDFSEQQDEPLNLCLRDTDGSQRSSDLDTLTEQLMSEKDLRYVRDGSNVWLMNQLGLFGSFPFNFRDPPKLPQSSILYGALKGQSQEKKDVPETVTPTEKRERSPEIQHSPSSSTHQDSEPELRSDLSKCKRAPIYIPPAVKAPTEVSICKFKFTGGPKPTLEKKKMLSVDAVGNFHFYSSTPQKTDVKPETQPSTSQNCQPYEAAIRKRRSKKSVLRKKLEKTFRDQGFLIQTQQFQAAQGATFCKFRQLKKFTRYLFRSWKEYLPDNLQGMAPHEEVLDEMDPLSFATTSPTPPSSPS